MVFFTCNHCGESVKKPAVEKHYNTKCRGAPIFVSCMDCLKDFRDQEFVEHTKCISEAEKYSGKGYVPKESQNKGQKKQDSWLEIVRSILTSPEYNLNPSVKSVFQRLQNYDNVPRKCAKFENFVSNSMKINKNQAKEVWKILEKELNKLKNSKSSANTANGNVKESNGCIENGDTTKSNTQEATEQETTEQANITKKKKKSKKRELEDNEMTNAVDETEIQEEPKKKKKKSKSESIVKESEVITELETNGKTDGNNEFYGKSIANTANGNVKNSNGHTENEDTKKSNKEESTEQENITKKKKKSKKLELENYEVASAVEENENSEEPKKKKKKSKSESIAEESEMITQVKTNGKSNENDVTFNWFNTISEYAKDGMTVEKLKEKVIKKHELILGHDESTNLNKIEKTFKKYFKKSGLTVDNDIIKIN